MHVNMKGTIGLSDLKCTTSMLHEIRVLLINARQRVAVKVNTELLSTYWKIGKIIINNEQKNKERADYGKQTLKQLSKYLTAEFGKGFSVSNLYNMRLFYMQSEPPTTKVAGFPAKNPNGFRYTGLSP